MIPFFKLIRWQNLLIVIITQFLIRYALIATLAGNMPLEGVMPQGMEPYLGLRLPFTDFLILVLSTVLITAGGYVINDYFDIRTDIVNKGEVIVGTRIPRRRAMMWHNILSAAGVILGFWVSYRINHLWLGIVFLLVSGLLYFYSVTYKRQFLVGNIVVSILTAMVPMLVVVFELAGMMNFYGPELISISAVKIIFYWVTAYGIFAFLTTLAREIVKDMEDFEGDSAYGSRSLPVVAGIKVSGIVASVIMALTIVLMIVMWAMFIGDIVSLLYILLATVLPLVFCIITLLGGRSDRLQTVSRTIKIVMLTGIFYTVLFWLIDNKGLSF